MGWLCLILLAVAAAGCGGGGSSNTSSNGAFSISPGTTNIDTNCTGCNAADSAGNPIEQFKATLSNGSPATVNWTISPQTGNIDQTTGRYTPPGYLTSDSVTVKVTAALASNPSSTASATLTVTPGFLAPLSPENMALGPNGNATITGTIAEAGGATGITFGLADKANGSGGGQGTLAPMPCARSSTSFTTCSAVYTAPGSISSTSAMYIVGTVGTSSSKDSAEVLLNDANGGVNSNPTMHQNQESAPVVLGSSGGNNNDYDTSTNSKGQTFVSDCCSGTLGALLKDANGTDYILSNNHVLARSDQAKAGDIITQRGLVDASCTPFGSGGDELPVATLTGWLPLSSASTDADAAIAKVDAGTVNTNGAILELGSRQADGTLAAAAPGTSSTAGMGENAVVGMTVAKSGRTTGLTCGTVSAIAVSNLQVSYFKDCSETTPYMTKTFNNQIGIEGNQFSDAGDSGSLIVDTSDAEPVGLFFAGGKDNSGNSQGIASPAPDVLNELGAQLGGMYTYVGTTDHAVSCLNYGGNPPTVTAAQARTLSGAQLASAQAAVRPARALVNPGAGILGVATGKSSDQPGAAAVIVYVGPGPAAKVPATVDGVRTVVVPTTAGAVATGSAPLNPFTAGAVAALPAAAVSRAIGVKNQVIAGVMKQNPAFFGMGVGQSYDDPTEPALVIYVDRNDLPATLPATIGGLRTRYIVMSRLHVTRSYASPVPVRSRCMLGAASAAKSPMKNNLASPKRLPLH